MKISLRILAALLACLMVALCGCSRESGAREAYEKGTAPHTAPENAPEADQTPGEEIPEPEAENPSEGDFDPAGEAQEDYEWYAARYITGLSLQRMEDFESPADISPNELVSFFFMANYEGEDKLPIPEGYRSAADGELLLPAEEVESFVTSLFEVEAIDIATSDYYDDEKKIYVVQGFGITGGAGSVEVTAVDRQGDVVELVFDVFVTLTDAEGEPVTVGPTATRSASFRDEGDRFKVLSLKTLYRADMDKLMEEAGLA